MASNESDWTAKILQFTCQRERMYKSLCHFKRERERFEQNSGRRARAQAKCQPTGQSTEAKCHGAVLSCLEIRTDRPSPELQAQGSGYAQKLQMGHLQT